MNRWPRRVEKTTTLSTLPSKDGTLRRMLGGGSSSVRRVRHAFEPRRKAQRAASFNGTPDLLLTSTSLQPNRPTPSSSGCLWSLFLREIIKPLVLTGHRAFLAISRLDPHLWGRPIISFCLAYPNGPLPPGVAAQKGGRGVVRKQVGCSVESWCVWALRDRTTRDSSSEQWVVAPQPRRDRFGAWEAAITWA